MKRWIVLVLASLMLLSLCSCAETAEESNAGVSSATQDESTPENEPAQQSSADSETGVLSHSTISETWDSGVVVDADVTAIKGETLSTYTGELRVFTVDELAEAFGLSVDSATSSMTDDSLEGYVPGTYTYLEFEDNRILISNMAHFSYESESFIKTRDLLSVHGNEANADAFQPVEKPAPAIKPEQVFCLETKSETEKASKQQLHFSPILFVFRHPAPDGGHSISKWPVFSDSWQQI